VSLKIEHYKDNNDW